jgi:hypothetical protein
MIIRSYACLNRRCRFEFDSEGDFPPCPRCRGIRVQWVPKPVAINSSRTAAIDKTARELAADFGLTDFRSPQPGRAAMPAPPISNPERPPAGRDGNMFEPARGWRIKLPDEALAGGGHAVCAPTGVTAKIKVDPNAGGLPATNWGPDRIRANTRIEGTHRARIPR